MSTTLYNSVRKLLNRNSDGAVSPVIGTILMVAVTVILGATVYAAVSVFGSKSVKDTPNVAFKAQAIDTDNDGKSDIIRITHMSGPDLALDQVQVIIKLASDGTSATTTELTIPAAAADTTTPADPWTAGEFAVFNPAATLTGPTGYLVSVSVLGTVVIDQVISLDE